MGRRNIAQVADTALSTNLTLLILNYLNKERSSIIVSSPIGLKYPNGNNKVSNVI